MKTEINDITPSDVMYHALACEYITMEKYMEWFKTGKTWEDVRKAINA